MCLIISGVMLTGALTVAAINGSPYETLKNAIFNVLSYENFVMEGEFTLTLNGEVEEHDTIHLIVTENGSLEIEMNRFTLTYNDIMFGRAYNSSGVQWYSARVDRWGSMSHLPAITYADRNSAQGQFIELFVDIMAGDLKNNMYMTTNDGIRTISGAITHNQLPELVRLGIEMVIEQSRSWYGGDYGTRDDFRHSHPMDIPIRSFTFDHISGEAKVDAMGNLLFLSGNAQATIVNVFGDINTIEVDITLSFSEIGTAIIEHPLTAAAMLFTPEFFEYEFGRRYVTLYFTLNDDGTMNRESLTDIWPGNLSHRNSIVESISDYLCDDYYACERFNMILERVAAYVEDGYYEEALDMVLEMMDITLEWDYDEEFICMFMLDRLIILTNDLNNRVLMANF